MKFTFLEKFEEKFYFKTSHFFWHFVIGLAALALVIGIFIFLWGISPSFKPGVDKPEFPEPVKVTATEIKARITPPVPPEPVQTPTPVAATPAPDTSAATPPPAAVIIEDPTEKAFQKAMDSLTVLLPPAKFAWESRGHWERGWYENRWVVDRVGISEQLNRVFKTSNAATFAAKTELINSYLSFLAAFPIELRGAVFSNLTELAEDNVAATQQNLTLLKSSVAIFSTDKADYLRDLVNFKKRNPNDGRPFIEYINQILPKFNAASRKVSLDVMMQFYYREFKELSKQQEATNLFLELLPAFQPQEQALALAEYYTVFLNKNSEREAQIEALNSEYTSELSRAEQTLAEKKQHKSEYRTLAWKLVGGSIVFIAFVALFLVLLSIQRNIKLLRESYPKIQS